MYSVYAPFGKQTHHTFNVGNNLRLIRLWCIFTSNKELCQDKVYHLQSLTMSG